MDIRFVALGSGFIDFFTLCLVAEKIEEKRRKVKEFN